VRDPDPLILATLRAPGLATLEISTRLDQLGIQRCLLIHNWRAFEDRFEIKSIMNTYTMKWLEKRKETRTMVPILRLVMPRARGRVQAQAGR